MAKSWTKAKTRFVFQKKDTQYLVGWRKRRNILGAVTRKRHDKLHINKLETEVKKGLFSGLNTFSARQSQTTCSKYSQSLVASS